VSIQLNLFGRDKGAKHDAVIKGLTALLVQRYIHNLNISVDFMRLTHIFQASWPCVYGVVRSDISLPHFKLNFPPVSNGNKLLTGVVVSSYRRWPSSLTKLHIEKKALLVLGEFGEK
jgi:hypothetical protein